MFITTRISGFASTNKEKDAVRQGKIDILRVGIAFGAGLSSLYLLCIVVMGLGGAPVSAKVLNGIFHGLDFTPMIHTDVPVSRRFVGLLGTFFVGALVGSVSGAVYNLFGNHVHGSKDVIIGGEETSEKEEATLGTDYVFYRSPLSVLPSIVLFIILSICAFYHSIKFPALTQVIGVIPVPLLGITPIVLLGYIVHRLYDRRYYIGKEYVRSIKGLLSFTKQDMRLEYKDIRGIEIDRSLYGRIFDIGTIRIGSAMSDSVELEMPGVRHPSYLRDLLLKYQKQALYHFDTSKGRKADTFQVEVGND